MLYNICIFSILAGRRVCVAAYRVLLCGVPFFSLTGKVFVGTQPISNAIY